MSGGGIDTIKPASHGRIEREVERFYEDFSIFEIFLREYRVLL
jgi:hypothetical protein